MLSFLLPLASKIISDAVARIPENEELGEKLIDICLVILSKAVKLTKTEMDDQLLEVAELRVHGCLFVQIFVQPLKRSTVCVVALGRKVVENLTLVDPNINKAND